MKYTKKADNENFDVESLDNIWTVDMFMDNLDSPDGHDTVEFTKIGLIDFLNEEIEKYAYPDDYSRLSQNASNEELKEAVYDYLEGKVISIEPYRRIQGSKMNKTAGWKVEKVSENDWIIHTPRGYYVDENDKEYHFSTKEKALAEIDYLRAEHKYEKKSELGFNANPENEEEERVLEVATELDNACFNAYKANGWNGWGTLEERQRGIDIAKKALAPLVEKYHKELSDDRFFKMLYWHNEDNNYHTENKALEELTGRKRRASMNRKAYYNEYEEYDSKSPEYIYSLLVNGNIAEYKKALNDMTKRELMQYLWWADEMGIDKSRLSLHYITASKKVAAEDEFEKAFENDLIIDDENDNAWFPGYEEHKFEIEPSYEKMKEKALKIWKQIHSSKKVTAENMDLDDVEEDNLSKSDFTDEMGIDDSKLNLHYITASKKVTAEDEDMPEDLRIIYNEFMDGAEESGIIFELIDQGFASNKGEAKKIIKEWSEDDIIFGSIKKQDSRKSARRTMPSRLRRKIAMRRKAGESYGWVVDSADAYDALDRFVEAFGTEEALDAITRGMSNDDLADTLAYIFRMYDFREGCSDYEKDEEED